MRTLRPLLLPLVLSAVFAGHAAIAVPARLLAELSAVACCEDHCEHSRNAGAAARCCGVESGEDRTVRTAAFELAPPVPVVLDAWAPAEVRFFAGTSPTKALLGPPARGAPVFLRLRSLRI